MASTTPNERLKEARQAKGYPSAAAAARAFGWSIPSYSHHENGTRRLMPDVAERYAQALGVEAAWLLYGEGARPILDLNEPVEPPPLDRLRAVPVVGIIEDGVWRPQTEQFAVQAYVPVVADGLDGVDLYAFRVRCEGAWSGYLDNTYAVISPALQTDLRQGDHVVVENEKGDGTVQRTLMEVAAAEHGVEMLPLLSKSAKRFVHGRDDDPDWHISGVVQSTYTRRPRSGRTLIRRISETD